MFPILFSVYQNNSQCRITSEIQSLDSVAKRCHKHYIYGKKFILFGSVKHASIPLFFRGEIRLQCGMQARIKRVFIATSKLMILYEKTRHSANKHANIFIRIRFCLRSLNDMKSISMKYYVLCCCKTLIFPNAKVGAAADSIGFWYKIWSLKSSCAVSKVSLIKFSQRDQQIFPQTPKHIGSHIWYKYRVLPFSRLFHEKSVSNWLF